MVDEGGRCFYGEFTDYDESQVSDWIEENVLSHLMLKDRGMMERLKNAFKDGGYDITMVRGGRAVVFSVLKHWLDKYDEIQFVSDVCHYDFVLLIDLFGTAFDLPNNICPSCHDINQDIASYYGVSEYTAFDINRDEIVDEPFLSEFVSKHNSLYDALVIRLVYSKVNNYTL
jgi:hypothetical protein